MSQKYFSNKGSMTLTQKNVVMFACKYLSI